MPYKDKNKKKKHSQKWQLDLRIRLIEYLGGKCVKCGFSDPRALQIDHINGDGNLMRTRSNHGWSQFYREIISKKYDGKVQLLCANCNWIKRRKDLGWEMQ